MHSLENDFHLPIAHPDPSPDGHAVSLISEPWVVCLIFYLSIAESHPCVPEVLGTAKLRVRSRGGGGRAGLVGGSGVDFVDGDLVVGAAEHSRVTRTSARGNDVMT